MFDIRGKYPEEINEEISAKTGGVFYNFCGGGPILIARDERKSSKGLLEAIKKSIPQIIDIGQSSTPLFAYSVIKSGARGGIMITASHLPANYNGFKFVKKNAEPLTEKEVEEIDLAVKKQKKFVEQRLKEGKCTIDEELAEFNPDELNDEDLFLYEKWKNGKLEFVDLNKHRVEQIGPHITEIVSQKGGGEGDENIRRDSREIFFEWLSKKWIDDEIQKKKAEKIMKRRAERRKDPDAMV